MDENEGQNEGGRKQEQEQFIDDPLGKVSKWDDLLSEEKERESDEEISLERVVESMEQKSKEIDNVTKGSNKLAQAYYTVLDTFGLSSKNNRIQQHQRVVDKYKMDLKATLDANSNLSKKLETERNQSKKSSDAAKTSMYQYKKCLEDLEAARIYLITQANMIKKQTAEQKDEERDLEKFYAAINDNKTKRGEIDEKCQLAKKRYERRTRDIVKFKNKSVKYDSLLERYYAVRDRLEAVIDHVEDVQDSLSMAKEEGAPTEAYKVMGQAGKAIQVPETIANAISEKTLEQAGMTLGIKGYDPKILTLDPVAQKLKKQREKLNKGYERAAEQEIQNDFAIESV